MLESETRRLLRYAPLIWPENFTLQAYLHLNSTELDLTSLNLTQLNSTRTYLSLFVVLERTEFLELLERREQELHDLQRTRLTLETDYEYELVGAGPLSRAQVQKGNFHEVLVYRSCRLRPSRASHRRSVSLRPSPRASAIGVD